MYHFEYILEYTHDRINTTFHRPYIYCGLVYVYYIHFLILYIRCLLYHIHFFYIILCLVLTIFTFNFTHYIVILWNNFHIWYQHDRFNVVSKIKRSVRELNHKHFRDLLNIGPIYGYVKGLLYLLLKINIYKLWNNLDKFGIKIIVIMRRVH